MNLNLINYHKNNVNYIFKFVLMILFLIVFDLGISIYCKDEKKEILIIYFKCFRLFINCFKICIPGIENNCIYEKFWIFERINHMIRQRLRSIIFIFLNSVSK